MTFRDRAVSTARDVLQVAFGPWPMPSAILLVASTMLFNYVVAGPYPGSGPLLAYQIALLPSSFLSAALFVLPVWLSNRLRRITGHRLTRTWYLTTILCAAFLMGVTRVPILRTQGYDVPFSVQAVAGFSIRSVVLSLLVFAVAGVASARIREQARRAEQALVQVQESQVALVETEERVRAEVSTFLHDRVQASLVALGLQLKFIARSADQETSRQILSLMEEVERIRTDDVRNAARQLSPDLETVGLVSALRTMGWTYQPAMEVEVVSTVGRERHIPPGVALAMYRITEQALLNAAVHGHATRVEVHLDLGDGYIAIVVQDNGSGLPPSSRSRGTGSLVMDTWSSLHGGHWSLEACSTGGTTLRAEFPWPEQV